jgi:hypothetical protein
MGRNRFIAKKFTKRPPLAVNLPAANAAMSFVTAISLDSTTDSAAGRSRSSVIKIFRFFFAEPRRRFRKRKNYKSMTRLMRQGSAPSSFFLTRKQA